MILNLYVNTKSILQLNLNFLIITLLITSTIFYTTKLFNWQLFGKNTSSVEFLRKTIVIVLVVSFFLHILTFWCYIQYYRLIKKNIIFSNYCYLPATVFEYNFVLFKTLHIPYINFSMDFFGMVLLTLAYVVGFLSLMALDTRLYWKNIKFVFSFNIFILIVFIFVSCSNLILFFLCYECLLIPSFFIVYFISTSRRAIQAAIYFLIWTQIGSFLVLCVISYFLSACNGISFLMLKNYTFTPTECWFIYFFLFLGFGFKVPIWPFHYWLTKTHVEAPAGFSMFLSGFLVKSAVYGFYKISNVLGGEIETTLFITIAMLGVVDASLKMWGQTDLKKLVAYGTIQEMNLIYLVFCWGDTRALLGGVLFCFTHAVLSALMFFLVDCVQRRYHSRSVTEISGMLHTTPNLALMILGMCVFYAGLPGTLKFSSEFFIFSGLYETAPFSSFLLILIANVFGLIAFSKCWFNVVFGAARKTFNDIPLDLTTKEVFINFWCFGLLFFSVFFTAFLF